MGTHSTKRTRTSIRRANESAESVDGKPTADTTSEHGKQLDSSPSEHRRERSQFGNVLFHARTWQEGPPPEWEQEHATFFE